LAFLVIHTVLEAPPPACGSRRHGLMSMAASVESANPVSGSPGVAIPQPPSGARVNVAKLE
jgi:hypothetical protein